MSEDISVDLKELKTSKSHTSLSTKLVCGAIAGIIGTCLIYPLDIVKTRLQNQTTVEYKGLFDGFSKLVQREGFRGLYRGLFANLIGISPEKAIKLAVNDYAREFWAKKLGIVEGQLPFQYGMLSGATAGICQVIVTNPMEIVKINMQMAALNSPTNSNINTMDVVKKLGFFGLYRGTLATLCRDVPFSFIFFPTLAGLKSLAPKSPSDDSVPFIYVFSSGVIAGAISAAAVTPMDVVKTRLQVAYKNASAPYQTMGDCYRFVLHRNGIAGLFKGVVPRVLIVSPLFAITVLVYEFQQKYLSS